MARINQGIFEKILNQRCELMVKYTEIMLAYPENVDRSFFEGVSKRCEDLYNEMDEFIGELRGIMEATKFEEATNKDKYIEILEEIEDKQEELKQYFNYCVEQLGKGGGLSDSENRTIEKYRIRK